MLLESRSEFLNEFITEGLRFSSSLYMTLIWLRVFRWVLNDPKSVKEKMNPQLGGFKDFFEDPTADNYMNCVFKEICKSYSQAAPSKSNTKRRLDEIYDSDDTDDDRVLPPVPSRFLHSSDEEAEEQPKKKKGNKNKKRKI